MKKTTPFPKGAREPCKKPEINKVKCMNGGSCFAVVIENSRMSSCSCTAEWQGERCEDRFIDASLWASEANTAGLAAGVTVALFLLLGSIVGIFFYCRHRSRNQQLRFSPPAKTQADDAAKCPDMVATLTADTTSGELTSIATQEITIVDKEDHYGVDAGDNNHISRSHVINPDVVGSTHELIRRT